MNLVTTIGKTPTEPDDLESITDTTEFEAVVMDFLEENTISQTPFSITSVQRADFLGNGTSSIIIVAHDVYLFYYNLNSCKEQSSWRIRLNNCRRLN